MAGDRRERMKRCEQGTRKARANERQPGIPDNVTDGSAGKGTDRHHSFDPDVDHTALFRDTGTECGIKQRRSIH